MMAAENLNVGEEIEVISGSMEYEWKISDFSSQEKYKGGIIREFDFLDAKWRLWLKCSVYSVMMSFKMERAFSDLRVNFTVGIKGSDGAFYGSADGVKDIRHSDLPQQPGESLCLASLFLHKAKIAPQDVLTVFCKLRVQQEYRERTTTDFTAQTEVCEDINELRRNFIDLLSSGEDSDVVIRVADREFRAHKAILRARCAVFSSMFGHDMKERDSGTLDVTDCDPQAFEQFLLHVYTGKVDYLSAENVCQLYQVADKYDIQDLKTECLEYMKRNLSPDNFCDVISLALLHKESVLLENATQFFLENAPEIAVTPKWLSFLKENPVEANELTIKTFHFLVRDRE